MAITGSFIGNCTLWNHNSGATEITDWMQVEAGYNIDAVKGEQAYSVKVRVRLIANQRMNYTGLQTSLIIQVDDQQQTELGNPSMDLQASGGEAGPWTDWYEFKYTVGASRSTINMTVTVDLSNITGLNSGHSGGPDSNSRPGWHYNKLIATKSVDVSGIVLGRPPVLTSLSNNNPYTNPTTGKQNGVSASVNSISVAINASDWGDPAATAYWSCSGKSGNTKSSGFSITGLTPGTSYTVTVYLKNTIGTSSSKSITIRTRHNTPVVSLTLTETFLEKLSFSWSSDKSMASTEYKIDDGSWVNLNQTGTSGNFTAQWFQPKTQHTIYFRGISTATYDSLNSNEANASGTTYDISHITNIEDLIFGVPFVVSIDGESDNEMSLRIWTEGNGRTAEIIVTPEKTDNTIKHNQSQWDDIYKTFPRANEMNMNFRLTTIGENGTYDDTDEVRILTLTGIARTSHIGIEGVPKRADVFFGVNGPKRCVTWIGDKDRIPRRCI